MKKLLRSILALLLAGSGALRAQETWTARPAGVTANLWSVAFGNGQWAALGEQGTILTSPDGLTWTPHSSDFPTRWLVGVAYGAGTWTIVGEGGLILTSPDATLWTTRASGTTARLNGIAYGGGRWMAVAESGELITSTDSVSWSRLSPSTDRLRGILYAYGQFVITGDNGLMRTTIDATDYAANVLPGSLYVESVTYGRRAFVAVGEDGFIVTSTDAVNWSRLASGTSSYLRGVTFFNGQFIAVGADGAIFTTPAPGTAWTPRNSGSTAILTAIAPSDSAVVAVGLGGTILRSAPASAAPQIALAPASSLAVAGDNVLFSVTATGSLPLSYQWLFNGQPLAGQTAENLLLTNVHSAQAGAYTVSVTNSLGSATSVPATLTLVVSTAPGPIVDPTFTSALIFEIPPRVAVLEQSDGKVIIGGAQLFLSNSVFPFALLRLNTDGTADPSFNIGTGVSPGGDIRQMVLQPDGRILVAGSFAAINGLVRQNLARLNADGSVDPTFTAASAAIAALPATQIALQGDGKLLVATNSRLLRLTADGSIDPVFRGPDSRLSVSFVAPLSGGRIIAGNSDALRHLNPDGSIDLAVAPIVAGFNTRGTFSSSSSTIRDLRPAADGKVYFMTHRDDAFYYSATSAYNESSDVLGRLNSDGFLDFSMSSPYVEIKGGPAPGAYVRSRSSSLVYAVDFQGRVLVEATSNIDSFRGFALARFDSTGLRDLTFDQRGGPGGGEIGSIHPLRDGRALVAGTFTSFDGVPRPKLARLVAANALARQRPVLVSVTPEAAAVRPGEPVNLTVVAAGSGPLTHQWSAAISAADRAKTTVQVPTALSGTYTVTVNVTNSVGAVTSAPVRVVVAPSAPIIATQPVAVVAASGRTAVLSVETWGSAPFTYQWYRGTTPVGTASTLTIAAVTPNDAGDYTVVVRNSLGSTTSQVARLTIDNAAQLINISTRATIGPAERTLIAGFVLRGTTTKNVLVRGIGPGLAPFGLTGLLANPTLSVYDGAGRIVATNDNWDSTATSSALFNRLGAFNLSGGSADAALQIALPPGNYTAQLTGAADSVGVALVEVYEADNTSSRIVNLSSRAFVGSGTSVAVGGITVDGENPRKFLIRGIGPALAGFGVGGALADPGITLTTALGATLATNDDWEQNANVAELRTVTAQLAFPLPAGSKDSALLLTLSPGSYTCIVSGTNATTGTALVEVYEVP